MNGLCGYGSAAAAGVSRSASDRGFSKTSAPVIGCSLQEYRGRGSVQSLRWSVAIDAIERVVYSVAGHGRQGLCRSLGVFSDRRMFHTNGGVKRRCNRYGEDYHREPRPAGFEIRLNCCTYRKSTLD